MAYWKTALAFVCIGFLSSQAIAADPVSVVLQRAAQAPVQGFKRHMHAEVRVKSKEPETMIDSFRANGPKTGQWQLHSIDGRVPTAKDKESHAKTNTLETVPGFHKLNELLDPTPDSQSVVNGHTIYRWDKLQKGAVETPGGDISNNLSAEAILAGPLDRPYFSQVRIYAKKPFRVKVVASINHFDVVSHYAQNESGWPYLTKQIVNTDVSAPMGLGGKRRAATIFTPLP